MHVPGAGGLHQRVLRVAPAAEQPPGARECNPVGSHRGDSRAVTGDLRVTAGARGTAGARRGNFVAAGGAADARQRAARSDAAAAGLDNAVGPPGDGRPGPRGALLRSVGAEPAVGGRHHVCAYSGRVSVSSHGAGRVQPQGGGLGHERAPDGRTRAGGTADGDRHAGTAQGRVPFRPRHPVHGAGGRRALRPSRHPAFDGHGR